VNICPVCGTEATITEGRIFSLIDGGELNHNELGHGRGWAYMRENDMISFPCGGYILEVGKPPRHLMDAL
jgi:hypothetical protein